MLEKIERILSRKPCLKAKEISKLLNIEKKVINSFLYNNTDFFRIDDNYCWSLVTSTNIKVKLPKNKWVNSYLLEKCINQETKKDISTLEKVTFIIPTKCKVLLDAAARLLAYCNQLAHKSKQVVIDFSSCKRTMFYFDRMGFFDQLISEVEVLPSRPSYSRAEQYKGSNKSLMEFGAIDLDALDETIPRQLKSAFVQHVGEQYSQPAFTVISELFGNVRDHSNTIIPGFAALQYYKNSKRPHIQTVVSDSGEGIIGTLKPILPKKYPELAQKYDLNTSDSASELLIHIFEDGMVSQVEDDGRGTGLKRSGDIAAKFNAEITIRQELFEVTLIYRRGNFICSKKCTSLPPLKGTHICFDFFLD